MPYALHPYQPFSLVALARLLASLLLLLADKDKDQALLR